MDLLITENIGKWLKFQLFIDKLIFILGLPLPDFMLPHEGVCSFFKSNAFLHNRDWKEIFSLLKQCSYS